MNTGKKITELREAAAVQGESRYPVSMGDGTGVKQVKHSTLVEQLKTDMGMTYEETLAMLRATDAEGNKKIPNLKAVSDWIASKITNNMMATEAGFFLDARLGPVIDNRFTAVENAVTQINSDLSTCIELASLEPGRNWTFFPSVNLNLYKFIFCCILKDGKIFDNPVMLPSCMFLLTDPGHPIIINNLLKLPNGILFCANSSIYSEDHRLGIYNNEAGEGYIGKVFGIK